MTNRQMVMVKLIQLSDEQFAELLNDNIGKLTGAFCKEFTDGNDDEYPVEKDAAKGCLSSLVEWLQRKVS